MATVWIRGPADGVVAEAVDTVAAGKAMQWIENAPLSLLAGVLERASLYIGNDSGVSHLAGAVGAPSVLVFGPTDPEVWDPRFPWVQIIRAKPSAQFGVSKKGGYRFAWSEKCDPLTAEVLGACLRLVALGPAVDGSRWPVGKRQTGGSC